MSKLNFFLKSGLIATLVVLSGCANQSPSVFTLQEDRIYGQNIPAADQIWRTNVVFTALSALGTPYRWGGDDPKEGFDCSGLVYFSYTQNGVDPEQMPRVTSQLVAQSKEIKREHLVEGDLVFFNTLGSRYSHVGIYMGKGRFINAPSKGGRVRIDQLDNPYYSQRFTSARRLNVARTDKIQVKNNTIPEAAHALRARLIKENLPG